METKKLPQQNMTTGILHKYFSECIFQNSKSKLLKIIAICTLLQYGRNHTLICYIRDTKNVYTFYSTYRPSTPTSSISSCSCLSVSKLPAKMQLHWNTLSPGFKKLLYNTSNNLKLWHNRYHIPTASSLKQIVRFSVIE